MRRGLEAGARPTDITSGGSILPNALYRNRIINDIRYAVTEARDAARVQHPGLVGRVRELAAEQILKPILPAAFEIGTGKIVDRNGSLSAEIDLVIYNRDLLPPLMYSARDGLYPIESAYYAFEIKSESSSAGVRDAIAKARQITALDHSRKDIYRGNKVPVVSVFFAFGSDLARQGKTEFDRYKECDPDWRDDPVIKVICVVGQGYWYYSAKENRWRWQPASDAYDEVLILISHTVITLVHSPLVSDRPGPAFGDYLRPPDKGTPIPG